MPLRKERCDQSLGLNCIRKLYWGDCFANEVGNSDLFLAHMCKHMHICMHIHMHTHTQSQSLQETTCLIPGWLLPKVCRRSWVRNWGDQMSLWMTAYRDGWEIQFQGTCLSWWLGSQVPRHLTCWEWVNCSISSLILSRFTWSDQGCQREWKSMENKGNSSRKHFLVSIKHRYLVSFSHILHEIRFSKNIFFHWTRRQS